MKEEKKCIIAVSFCGLDPVVLEGVECSRERLKLRSSRLEVRLDEEKAPEILGVAAGGAGAQDPEAMVDKGGAFDPGFVGKG